MKRVKHILGLFIVILVVLLWYHRVPNNLTKQDIAALEEQLGVAVFSMDIQHFSQEINQIKKIQQAIHQKVELGEGVPYYSKREPADLFAHNSGLCYDFSRTIEKALRHAGYNTRHVALYPKARDKSIFYITKSQIPSHATLEVKTSRGWMIVDSNTDWVALTKDSTAIEMADLQQENLVWLYPMPKQYDYFYNGATKFIYGLYSRHGGFYPPYNAIPDVNYRELLYNL